MGLIMSDISYTEMSISLLSCLLIAGCIRLVFKKRSLSNMIGIGDIILIVSLIPSCKVLHFYLLLFISSFLTIVYGLLTCFLYTISTKTFEIPFAPFLLIGYCIAPLIEKIFLL
jgi:prepilin signal peptidase PulO-like enzyme (type II secretory pathway)